MTSRAHRVSVAGTASHFAIIFSLLFAGAGRSAEEPRLKPAPGNGMSILFIGNSLTYANDLPLLVQALAKAAGRSVHVESVTFGDYSLEDQWNNGAAQRAIARRKWSVVVLQQGSLSLPESRVILRQWTKQFAPLIRKAGGRPALYMVWPSEDRAAYFDAVRESYSLAASDVRGIFLPAGEAWRAAWRRDPQAPLYAADGFHPSEAGTYTVALSIYGVLFQRSPQGLPARLEPANGDVAEVPQALAKLLQAAAAEARQDDSRQALRSSLPAS